MNVAELMEICTSFTKELKCLIVDVRRDVVTCAMLRPLRNIFRYSAIKMVAVTLVVTVSLVWHMQ